MVPSKTHHLRAYKPRLAVVGFNEVASHHLTHLLSPPLPPPHQDLPMTVVYIDEAGAEVKAVMQLLELDDEAATSQVRAQRLRRGATIFGGCSMCGYCLKLSIYTV